MAYAARHTGTIIGSYGEEGYFVFRWHVVAVSG